MLGTNPLLRFGRNVSTNSLLRSFVVTIISERYAVLLISTIVLND